MIIEIKMTIAVADDNELFVDDFSPEDNVALFVENRIDGEEGLEVMECYGSEYIEE